jgi:hypothetical protein
VLALHPNLNSVNARRWRVFRQCNGLLRNDWRLVLAQVPNERILVGGLSLTREEPAQLQPT